MSIIVQPRLLLYTYFHQTIFVTVFRVNDINILFIIWFRYFIVNICIWSDEIIILRNNILDYKSSGEILISLRRMLFHGYTFSFNKILGFFDVVP